MTPDGAFDRRLTTWLEEDAAPRAPQGFDEAVTESVDRKRQLPSWATPERWISMETRARLGAMPRTLIVVMTLALLTVLAAAIVAGSNQRELPSPFGLAANGPLVYAAQGDIWLRDENGETTRLTSDDTVDKWPAWALDGSQLAYVAYADGAFGLMVVDADGSDPRPVATGLSASPGYVRWKPDSTAVAFAQVDEALIDEACGDRFSGVCGSRVWVAAADGSSLQQVGRDDLDAFAPAWSPDGETIVFSGRVTDQEEEAFGLYLMAADGTDVRRLSDVTGPPGYSLYWHQWSPDGTRILTESIPNSIFVVDVETGQSSVAYSGPAAQLAVWSPDGTAIAASTPQYGAVIVDEDGVATEIDAPVRYVHWTPDGTMLVGASDFSEHPVVGKELDVGGPAVLLFDNDGELLEAIDLPAMESTVEFQRLAP